MLSTDNEAITISATNCCIQLFKTEFTETADPIESYSLSKLSQQKWIIENRCWLDQNQRNEEICGMTSRVLFPLTDQPIILKTTHNIRNTNIIFTSYGVFCEWSILYSETKPDTNEINLTLRELTTMCWHP